MGEIKWGSRKDTIKDKEGALRPFLSILQPT